MANSPVIQLIGNILQNLIFQRMTLLYELVQEWLEGAVCVIIWQKVVNLLLNFSACCF